MPEGGEDRPVYDSAVSRCTKTLTLYTGKLQNIPFSILTTDHSQLSKCLQGRKSFIDLGCQLCIDISLAQIFLFALFFLSVVSMQP